jgi:thioredoxin 1
MAFNETYSAPEPVRADVDAMKGATLLEFGTSWCGYCMGAQTDIRDALTPHEGTITHLKVEDGKGRPLGRSYRVTLWPTLIFLRDGREVARLVRPNGSAPIRDMLARIDPHS